MVVADIWGESNHKCIVAIKSGRVNHIWADSAQDAQDKASKLAPNGFDVYFAPSAFDSQRRTQDCAADIPALWIDIDCGEGKTYPDWKRGLLALLVWCKKNTVPNPTHLVLSGYGVHCYWALDAAYPHSAWLPVAQHFKQALKVGGVDADPTRTADSASIMRLPGTYNWKDPSDPKPVKEFYTSKRRIALDEFEAALPKVGPIRPVREKPQDDEWGVPDNYPEADAEGVASKCQQMAAMKESQGAGMSEPLWRAGLSILKRCNDADHFVHEWSRGDERYNAQETQDKADRTGGPATCQHFSDCNPGGCVGCPHAGKITSPVQLSVAGATAPAPEPRPNVMGAAQPDEQEPVARPNTVNRFKVTDAGIYYEPPASDDDPAPAPLRVTEVPIWIDEVREKARHDTEADASSLVLVWRSVDGREKRGVLHQSDVHEMRQFKAWLADYNIIAATNDTKLLIMYISQYTLKLLKKDGAKEYHDTLGWYKDGFVVGDRIITKDGARQALIQTSNPIGKLTAKGDVAKWSEAVNRLDAPGYEYHAFSVLCGFGSPILSMVGVQSAVVSLVGVSGAGKTLSAKAALSIYGDPELLMQGASATNNAVEKQMACNRHVPYLLDEVTQFPVHKLTEFIYTAANGQGKAALTRSRESREAGSWQMVPFMTSNQPALEFHQKDVQEAHRRRLIEVFFPHAMTGEDGRAIDEAVRHHHGVAAEPYLKALIRYREKIPAMFEQAMEKLRADGGIVDANRFGMWTIAAAMVGGAIAKAVGLISFNATEVVQKVVSSFKEDVASTETDEERAVNSLKEFLAQHSKQVCRWSTSGNALGEVVDDPVARDMGNGVVAVHRRMFNEVMQEQRISKSSIKHWMKDNVMETKTVRLAPGTPGVWAHLIKADAVGFTSEVD